ncbi:MAG: hypothetical protein K0S93_45 [Nitrososphaeraceae archaeon]|jgi:hypothetical protein|nr:hypothetical protein [Nitrososphaeraceae archaeon]
MKCARCKVEEIIEIRIKMYDFKVDKNTHVNDLNDYYKGKLDAYEEIKEFLK